MTALLIVIGACFTLLIMEVCAFALLGAWKPGSTVETDGVGAAA